MDSKEVSIEIEEISEKRESTDVQLPLNFLRFGEIENDDVKVYIKQDVYKSLEKLSSSDTTKELGSILIGDFYVHMGKMHVIVSGYIEAKYTDSSASTLTFTHKTWEYIHKEQERLYPDKKIVGWQHTHPNYGIFLSNYDMFIQDNFFNLPFQVAYVIDPIQNIRGFFQWKNEKTEKLGGYYIYDDVGKPIKIEQKKVEKKNKNSSSALKVLTVALILALCTTSVLLSILVIRMREKYYEAPAFSASVQESIIAEEKIDEPEKSADLKTPATEFGEKVMQFVEYIVQKGDSLADICKKFKLKYNLYKTIILSVNGISDPDLIKVGQLLLLPKEIEANN